MENFLNIPDNKKLYTSNHFFIIKDSYPVSPGHLLIISNELHIEFFELPLEVKNELPSLIDIAKKLIERENKPDGYNIGMNCGSSAGQTIFHFHCHIIPRYQGDLKNPEGGIRGVIPNKMNY
ncbi:HIT family protein [Altibacter sp. HG106]|uniref:HIT family protein n=1 Tax=Altibacter sp. HG106 TaxID=3023937 RepID=UPI0023507E74|nr:HIT family protein [Altibacter sp. HG106]MDC7994027.1 HIT family protein [Altibacter sp. HG106]